MAHPKSKRMALRSAYCYKALSLEEAAALVGISIGTARRWKTDAQKAEDDDWDKVKAASSLAGEGMEAVARQMLNDYVLQHKTNWRRLSASSASWSTLRASGSRSTPRRCLRCWNLSAR